MISGYKRNISLIYFLQLIWLSHFIQVLVPETGFDAVWYHLPVVKSILENGKIIFSPGLYQSLNPLFSDLFFMIGYFFLGIIGAKIVAYLFAIALVSATYKLARIFLDSKLSLGIIILVSTFQVVSWQSSSFYVDVAKAFWEILTILFIVRSIDTKATSDKIKSVFAFGASLATKLFSIFLFPVFLFIFPGSLKSKLLLFLAFIVPVFFYLNSYSITGNMFYSFSVHLAKLSEIGGSGNLSEYFYSRSIFLIRSPLKLALSKDYLSPLISILLIPIIFKIKKIIQNKKLLILLIFSLAQWLLWWYLPPLSTRYALSGFITLLILEICVLRKYFSKINKDKILIIMMVFATINFMPRLFVNYRSLRYLLSNQTQKQYIEQFYDGSIDQKFKDWYGY